MKVECDNALNEAGWKMVEEMRLVDGLSAKHFNSIKPCLKSAIECWISHKYEFEVPTETPEEREALDTIDTTSKQVEKPNSGQDVYIAQINTLAGVESQRYFIHQYWCDSGHQNQLLKLGILFTDMDKAILKTKSLLGIPHETPEQKAERERQCAVYDMCSDLDNHTDDARFWCGKLYDSGYRKAK